jgi:hypothetical protein
MAGDGLCYQIGGVNDMIASVSSGAGCEDTAIFFNIAMLQDLPTMARS